MGRFFLVCLGGALGTGARYALGNLVLAWSGAGAFPWHTLAVNAIGSFALSFLGHVSLATEWVSPTSRAVIATGVLGGFTTYSSFNYETLSLFERGGTLLAALNLVCTVCGCLLAGLLGAAAARTMVGP